MQDERYDIENIIQLAQLKRQFTVQWTTLPFSQVNKITTQRGKLQICIKSNQKEQ